MSLVISSAAFPGFILEHFVSISDGIDHAQTDFHYKRVHNLAQTNLHFRRADNFATVIQIGYMHFARAD